MKKKKNNIYLIVFVTLLFSLIGATYAYFRVNTTNDTTLGGVIGKIECLDITYSESNIIELDNQYPITDEYALDNLTPLTVTVTNNCTNEQEPIDYVLTYTSLSENTGYIPDSKIRILVKRQKGSNEEKTSILPTYVNNLENLTSGTTYTMLSNDLNTRNITKDYTNKTSYVIDREEIESNTTNIYKVYLWIDYWEGDTTHTGLNNNSTMGLDYKSAISLVVNSEETPKYLVTFDTNGGTLNSENASKVVYLGEEYGELPIPTREGYEFLGWNGKNLFNKANYLLLKDYPIQINSYYWGTISLKPNTRYKLSIIRYNGYTGKGNYYLIVNKEKSATSSYFSIAHNNYPNYEGLNYYDTDSDGVLYIGRVWVTQADLNKIWQNTNFQIEEGTEATPYEPYFVTSDVIVTQQKDHILKAIWEPVS